jgi:Xaa-Pro aminopeptidase
METMQPALKNGRNVWDQTNMPVQEFQARLRAVREKMKAQDMDLLLAYGHAFNEYGNPSYFSNYLIRLPRGVLVSIPMEGEVTLFFEGAARGLPSAKMLTWIEDVRPCPDISRACVQYLKEKDMDMGTFGFAGLNRLMPQHQLKYLIEELSQTRIIDADDLIQELRRIKSTKEVDQIRRASNIVKRTLQFICETAFPSMNERMVEAMLFRQARLEGAEDVRVLFGKPHKPAWSLRPSGDATFEPGRGIIIFLAVAYERYWSEGIRTYIAGDHAFTTPDLEGTEAIYQQMTECMKPGESIGQCCKEAMGKIPKGGLDLLEDYGMGQGIGLSMKERPLMELHETGELEEGVCFTLRLGVGDETIGAAMIGNTFCVTNAGLEGLTG